MSYVVKYFFLRRILRFSFYFFLLLFFCRCNHLFYYPSKQLFHPTPEALGLSAKNIFFTSQDKTKLHGWFFSHSHPKGTIIQFHGNSENLSSHYLSVAWLVKHGYNVFTFDYRGYGRSSSKTSPQGIRKDGLSALQKAIQIHKDTAPKGKFIVIGQSLGGAIALKAIEDLESQDQIDLLVLDSPFVSYQSITTKKLSSYWLTWPLQSLSSILISDQTSAKNFLKELSTPLLLIHSEKDSTVPFSCSEALFNHTSMKDKYFWKLKTPGHVIGFYSKIQQIRFLNFLANNLK